MNTKLTITRVRHDLDNHGVVLRKQDGEYRVNYRGGLEATAAYTNDLADALATGLAMARAGNPYSLEK